MGMTMSQESLVRICVSVYLGLTLSKKHFTKISHKAIIF